MPFLYATNGEIIWYLDTLGEKPVSRQLKRFHPSPALEEMFTLHTTPGRKWLLDSPPA